jgi:hypothetical protein
MSLPVEGMRPIPPPPAEIWTRSKTAWIVGLAIATFVVVAILVVYGLASASAPGGCGGG